MPSTAPPALPDPQPEAPPQAAGAAELDPGCKYKWR